VDSLLVRARALLYSRIFRVACIGGVGFIVQTIVFETLFLLLGVRPSLAVVVGGECGILSNFFLNNRFSFNDRAHAPLPLRLLRFHTVVSGSLILQWICVYTAEMLGAGWLALHGAYVLGIALGFISNYSGYRLWVWRHHGSPNA